MTTTADDMHRCPICAEPFKPDDICATDITEGPCHAACLEGSPVVDLQTGDDIPDGKVDTYPYSEIMDPAPQSKKLGEYLVWSNEHKCWWGPNRAGYVGRLQDAGRYTREEALKICVNARGGRQFNSNPSEVPLPLADAEAFWPDDQDEWRVARHKHENPPAWEYEE